MSKIIVFFDNSCPLCEQLAAFGARYQLPDLIFTAWQSFVHAQEQYLILPKAGLELEPTKLRILKDGEFIDGVDAWAELIRVHPDLKTLHWLAQRLHLVEPTAKIVSLGASLLRGMCKRCPKIP